MLRVTLWFVGLLALGVLGRVIPHWPNFTPTLAVALFAGCVLPGGVALLVAPLSVLLGDVVLGFHDEMAVVYLTLLPLVWLGARRGNVFGLSAFANLLFFFTTNFAVWWDSGMYAHSAAGLVSCFTLALPFLGYSFAATLVYLGALRLLEVATRTRRLAYARTPRA